MITVSFEIPLRPDDVPQHRRAHKRIRIDQSCQSLPANNDDASYSVVVQQPTKDNPTTATKSSNTLDEFAQGVKNGEFSKSVLNMGGTRRKTPI